MRTETYIAEVGFPHAHADISLTGIQAVSITEGIKYPRLVIFENGGDYQIHHDEYAESVGNARGEIFYGNIYQPESLQNLPPIGLLILENVITDPSFHDQVWEGLLTLLDTKVVVGGIILLIDHAFGALTAVTYESLKNEVIKSLKFSILIDQVRQPPYSSVFSSSEELMISSEAIVQVILSNLEKLGLLDQAVNDGLNTLDSEYKHVLVLKKK